MDQKGSVSSWTRDQLEDQYLRLYDDFLTLKKHCCKQEERIKKMATKILRLASDRKSGAANNVWEDDYREQIENLERKNAALSQKLLLAQNQVNVQRQRVGSAPGMGRPLNRANVRTLVATPRDSRRRDSAATGALQTARMQNAALEQTIKKLSEHLQEREKTIGQLKEELLTKDASHRNDTQALLSQLTSKQRDTLKENIDLIRNQRELREKQLQITTLRARIHDFEADQTATKEANRKLVSEVERLTNEIALLEQKSIHMESTATSAAKDHLKVLELQNALDDVKRENQVLKESNEKLMANAFSGMSEQSWLRQEQKLRSQISQLEAMLRRQSSAKTGTASTTITPAPGIEEMCTRAQTVTTVASAPPARSNSVVSGGNEIFAGSVINKSTATTIAKAAGFNADELEEALMLLRERRSKLSHEGDVDLGFLTKVETSEAQDLGKRLHESEAAHADTIAELNKTRKLLSVQYRINKDYRAESAELSERLTALKSESEQRLIEYAKLLDIRAARIRQLEGQLEQKSYGTKSVKSIKSVDMEGICAEEVLSSVHASMNASEPGRVENLIEIHVGQLSLSANAANQLLTGLVQSDSTTSGSALQDFGRLRLFLTWDFYDFETQATPVRNGMVADFNLTVQYPVNLDDFMLSYLHRGQCWIELHQSLDNQYRTVAKGQLNMALLLQTNDTTNALKNVDETVSRYHGQLDLYGADTGPAQCIGMIIGKLDYWIRLSVPMPQALRIYRERFRGLPRPQAHPSRSVTQRVESMSKTVPPTASDMQDSDSSENQLCIYITSASDLRARRPDCIPSPYFVYQFYDQPEQVSAVMEACTNAKFDHLQSYRVCMDEKLDQYIRTQQLTVYLIDNADPEEAASCLGAAQIPLLGLVTRGANNGRLEGVFAVHPLASLSGPDQPNSIKAPSLTETNGQIHIKLYWQRPYAFGQPKGTNSALSGHSTAVDEENKEEVLAATTLQSVQSKPTTADHRLNKALELHKTVSMNEPTRPLGRLDPLIEVKQNGLEDATGPKRSHGTRNKSEKKGSNKRDMEDVPHAEPLVISTKKPSPEKSHDHSANDTAKKADPVRRTQKSPTESVDHERSIASPDQTSTEGSNFPKPMPRQKLGKTQSPEPPKADIQAVSKGQKETESKSLTIEATDNSSRKTPIGDIDEAHVQICLHRIKLTRKPVGWKDWSRMHRVFVEYRFLGFKEPFETTSCVMNGSTTMGDEQIYEAELNYSKTFDVDFAENYQRRQHLASYLLAEDPKRGQIQFVIVTEPTSPSQSSECEEIGVARVNVRHILLKGSEPVNEPIPIQPMESTEGSSKTEPNKNSTLGYLNVSIHCLAALRSTMNEMPGTLLTD